MREISSCFQVVNFLSFFHSLRSHDVEDRILTEEVKDQRSAKFQVESLFEFIPYLACWFIEFVEVFDAHFGAIVANFFLEHALIEIESSY